VCGVRKGGFGGGGHFESEAQSLHVTIREKHVDASCRLAFQFVLHLAFFDQFMSD